MNRNTIIESAYETIRESLEWKSDCSKDYPNVFPSYINGIVDATDNLLKKLEEENKCKEFVEDIEPMKERLEEVMYVTKDCQ